MGFFSWRCIRCGRSLLSMHATLRGKVDNDWMKHVVVMENNGTQLIGEYDGYGRVNEKDINWQNGDPCCYHYACWRKAGQPSYGPPSPSAEDQGFFFDEEDYDVEEPEYETEPYEYKKKEAGTGKTLDIDILKLKLKTFLSCECGATPEYSIDQRSGVLMIYVDAHKCKGAKNGS